MTLLKSLAYETLTEVRQSIKHKKAHLPEKDQHIFGQGANTQAQTVLRTATQIIQTHAERYNFIRERLLKLGLPLNDAVFWPLDSLELWMHDPKKTWERKSDKLEPWFWRVGIAEGTTEAKRDEWEREHESIREDSVSLTHLFLVDRVR